MIRRRRSDDEEEGAERFIHNDVPNAGAGTRPQALARGASFGAPGDIRIFDCSDEDGGTRDKEGNVEDGDRDTSGVYDIQTDVDAESDTVTYTESIIEPEVDNRLPWDRNLASFPLIPRFRGADCKDIISRLLSLPPPCEPSPRRNCKVCYNKMKAEERLN